MATKACVGPAACPPGKTCPIAAATAATKVCTDPASCPPTKDCPLPAADATAVAAAGQ